jgi:hypothetical protein
MTRWTIAILCGLLAAGGCVTSQRAASLPAVPAANAELTEYIGDQAILTAESAYRATYCLKHGSAFDGDFAALTAALVSEGVADGNWGFSADTYLDRASAAVLICRAAEIRGGLLWPLTGLGRYAWRELQYRRIAGAGSELAPISGGEFLGLLAKAEEYRVRAGRALQTRTELGPQP